MVRLAIAAITFVTAVAGAWLLTPPEVALACSAPGIDRVAESEVIVAGRVASWERAADVPPFPGGNFIPVRMHVDVDRVFKGSTGPLVDVIDVASLELDPQMRWLGASGACGALNEDPTGQYFIFGLRRASDGTLRTALPRLFFVGDNPPGDFSTPGLSDIAPLLPGALPQTGGPPAASRDPVFFVVAMGLGSLALLTSVACFAGVRRSPNC